MQPATTTHTATTTSTPVSPEQARRVRESGPDTISVPIPLVGTVRLSRPELAYVGGIVALSAFGLIEWPIALVIAGGHVLAADRSSQTTRELGEAMAEA